MFSPSFPHPHSFEMDQIYGSVVQSLFPIQLIKMKNFIWYSSSVSVPYPHLRTCIKCMVLLFSLYTPSTLMKMDQDRDISSMFVHPIFPHIPLSISCISSLCIALKNGFYKSLMSFNVAEVFQLVYLFISTVFFSLLCLLIHFD